MVSKSSTNRVPITKILCLQIFQPTLSSMPLPSSWPHGDTYWLQKCCTAMGTNAVQYVLPNFWWNLLFYCQFINNGIGIWINYPSNPHAWECFFTCLNNWDVLKWTCNTGRTSQLEFLDLTFSITEQNNHLHFTTFQKAMNLYLYLPPMPTHPPNMLCGLVFGHLQTWWLQSTNHKDYLTMASLLTQWLIDRGYSLKTICPLFIEATTRLETHGPYHCPQQTANLDVKPIFFHLPFHPQGITQ